ncbi:putative fatty acyl-CoA reductase CG5065 isoform X1 [Bombus impatiens]|uniref:Fatty acyl-CoA reductase n=1 Tax=Bombus impatiens TaxID=132113 RepID=A0A6P8KVA1_BOMIM|nr:putative fatty acyl-CoA reductase CG5065 isoform X1 [Bombus impatiens]XP_024220316.1 putative fatty acyl-CoA reductase CG5065 isoform X1 [Bombus impatiens]XP_033174409.1 putative fatty acyl-CoA reductase CG5065 isoform X1 [Bombus impatiens]XP_033174410.1 putative fatty acyl-CoA reductase CG5065 isoform X1 [Bombus impatiens]
MDTINKETNENGTNEGLNKTNSLEEFYAGSGILVTGGTGFLGVGLLEKLMRVCPRIAAIYILIRPKTNETIEQRFKKVMDNPIYDGIKAKNTSLFNRVYPVKGDVSLPDLGLSREDRNLLLEKVNIVFHSAATVRFNEPLDVAVNVNTKGTARVIELWNELKHPISFVHVSTAFSNANLHEIEEKVYTTSLKPSDVIDICDKFDKTSINVMEKRILKTYPNTYTFSKNLAEQVVASKCKDLPVAIVRPSIVGASLEEPCPGWIHNISALTGTFLLIGKGCVTAIRGRRDARLDVVPVDFVVDTIICTAWHVTLHPDHEVKVYNCTSNAYPFKWGQMKDTMVKCSIETPLNDTLWYPGCPMIANRYIYNVRSVIPHVLPAFVIDIFLRLRGSKPILMKLLNNGNKLFTSLQYFILHEWTFQRDNCSDLARKVKILNDSDMVKLDLRVMNWEKYVAIYLMGIKKFILKEDVNSIARQRLSRLFWIHQITKICGIIILLWIILCFVY